jgi:putative spermidine/putrescine transport system ATP-binding protein
VTGGRVGHLRMEGLSRRYGQAVALRDISLDVEAGEFITLLGPSGSGKTTTLKIVAGFIAPDAGRVILDDDDITQVPPHLRDIGMVFQNYALFPHLSVAKNLAFPLEMRRLPRAMIRQRVEAALSLVRLAGFGDRRPRELSGGQQQRVALARALVFKPRLLLMDEPLGALDRKLREAMQLEIINICREIGHTVLYVTHDQEEALAMSNRIAVYHDGRIEQVGTPEEIYERPANLFVATFVGESTTFLGHLERDGEGLRLVGNGLSIPVSEKSIRRTALGTGSPAALVVRPEAISICCPDAEGHQLALGKRAAVRGRVLNHVYLGAARKNVIELKGGNRALVRLPSERIGEPNVKPGQEVEIRWEIESGIIVPQDEAVATPSADIRRGESAK